MTLTNPAARWVRRNLFATSFDSALTLIFVPLCMWAVLSILGWAIYQARWSVVGENLRVLLVGTFPAAMMWRAWSTTLILAGLAGATMGLVAPPKPKTLRRSAAALAILAATGYFLASAAEWTAASIGVAILAWMVIGTFAPLRQLVAPAWLVGFVAMATLMSAGGAEHWGGLLMSILFTVAASVLSALLGIALAFGRRSRFSSARIICTAYIEVMRSLPLILIVYCVWIVIPLLAPSIAIPDIARGLLGFSLFFGAYVAEYVRSGLQSIPKGQVEAALSLGMKSSHVTRDIVLPQATRVVMPALVGNVLDIFNTVPLLFIIGLTDFLRAGQMILVNPQYGNRTYEVYVFLFALYLVIASAITYGARRLETRMTIGRH